MAGVSVGLGETVGAAEEVEAWADLAGVTAMVVTVTVVAAVAWVVACVEAAQTVVVGKQVDLVATLEGQGVTGASEAAR